MDYTDIRNFLGASALVWLDNEGHLRIEAKAPAQLKDFARANRAALVAALQSLGCVSPLRLLQVMGIFAVTTPTGNVPPHVAAAIRAAGLNCLAVCNSATEGRGVPYEVWLRRQPIEKFCDPAELERWVKRRQALKDRPVSNKRSIANDAVYPVTMSLFDNNE